MRHFLFSPRLGTPPRGQHIPSYQYNDSGQLSYDEFIRRMAEANKVALLLDVEQAGKQWITFSLSGSSPALHKIGALGSIATTQPSAGERAVFARVRRNSVGRSEAPISSLLVDDQAWVDRARRVLVRLCGLTAFEGRRAPYPADSLTCQN
jgi:hypothetical protein